MGSVYRRNKTYWIAYYRNGRLFRESSHSDREGEATRLLRLREGDIAKGLPVSPAIGRLTFAEAAADVRTDYQINGKRSLEALDQRLNLHLLPYFGHRRMATITTGDIRTFIAKRQSDTVHVRKARRVRLPNGETIEEPEIRKPLSNGEINRELAILRRVFSLAIQNEKLLHKPYVPMLKEAPPRSGFFEAEQLAAVIRHLPEALKPVIAFAATTGWRTHAEILTLEWRHINFIAGEIRLDASHSKNGEARVFPMTAHLREMLLQRWSDTKALERKIGRVIPLVFYRGDGKRIGDITKAFRTACRRAGCPGRIVHDLRRTAIRNFVRAGIREDVAMKLSGHRTRNVFSRYNITSPSDLTLAAEMIDASPSSAAFTPYAQTAAESLPQAEAENRIAQVS